MLLFLLIFALFGFYLLFSIISHQKRKTQNFTSSHLEHFFHQMEGKKLDESQRTAVLSQADNCLIIARSTAVVKR
ncbi:MAG: hypothetical protein IJ215_02725 [Clostridia bacterium]|nr:hypothetical protein [Clostridia bacterium]